MDFEALRTLRRELHRIPEPAWCEFQTTATLIDELEARDVDHIFVGPDVLDPAARMGVPDEETQQVWYDRALEAGSRADVLKQLEGGQTGVVAVLECGHRSDSDADSPSTSHSHPHPGPTIGLRVDIDGLVLDEATGPDHIPEAEGFHSAYESTMHACGHDAHMTMGLGVIDAIRSSEDFQGTLKVFFQPAEEVIGGGKAMAEGGHLEDVDYLLAVHIGLDHPTGEVVAGIDGFLAVSHLDVTFHGESAHAGARPQDGHNAIQAMATAIENCYGIPRHSDGATRVNVGVVEGGTASNIIAETARMEVEARGETTALMLYMAEKVETVCQSAATMHDCTVDHERGASAPSAESNDELAAIVGEVAGSVTGVDRILPSDQLGGSEDATYLMRAVQQRGGLACYVGVGTDHPGGHHTPTFDVDEESIRHGIEVLSGTIERISLERP